MKRTNYFCDRCGGEKRGHPSIDITIRDGTEIREIGWITFNCKTSYKHSIDLCENCLTDLRDWYRAKQTTEIGDFID